MHFYNVKAMAVKMIRVFFTFEPGVLILITATPSLISECTCLYPGKCSRSKLQV